MAGLGGAGSRPQVTVGITTYNASEYVGVCLMSLVSQELDPGCIEVIVVDDGSTDDTVAKAEEFRYRAPWARFSVLTQENTGGPATGRNRVLAEAHGEYTFFVDVDDYLGPKALARMCELGAVSRAQVVIGKYVGVHRGVPKYLFRKTLPSTNLREASLTDSMNVLKMFKTSFVREIGYHFKRSIKMAEDHPFALAAYVHATRVAIVADTDCYFWVRHETERGAAQHLTGHILPVEEFYAYMHEAFGVLAQARASAAPFVEDGAIRYWNRLLGFDIPRELNRNRPEDGAELSVAAAREIAELYGLERHALSLAPRASAMAAALRCNDSRWVRRLANEISK